MKLSWWKTPWEKRQLHLHFYTVFSFEEFLQTFGKNVRNRYFTSATDALGISTSEERVCGLQNQKLIYVAGLKMRSKEKEQWRCNRKYNLYWRRWRRKWKRSIGKDMQRLLWKWTELSFNFYLFVGCLHESRHRESHRMHCTWRWKDSSELVPSCHLMRSRDQTQVTRHKCERLYLLNHLPGTRLTLDINSVPHLLPWKT